MAKSNIEFSTESAFWISQIETYEQQFGPWEKRSKKIVDRYMDERDDIQKTAARFNVLWSNIQTLHPAIYASPPTPNIDRRFDNDDDLGRYSALVLERSVSYYVKNDLFDKVMKQTSLDRLLSGRGVAWVRYCPVFEEKLQVTDDAMDKEEDYEADLVTEDTIPDYVHWQDFGHTWARTWQEVRGVWRRVFMTRAEMVKRFGEKGQNVPLDAVIKGKNDESLASGKKATIYEIWDKTEKKAIWLHKSMENILDEADDPLGLKDFFPCPEPIYATLSNNSLIPTPDYVQYQDQACELDLITGRIAAITKALKVAGVYDAAAQGIDRLLSEGTENKLIPVEQWAVLGGGKGLEGAISLFPLQEIMATVTGLYAAREQVKNDLYEITGISDIVRGQGKANETATAQEIKGQFATLRLDNNQKDVARFAKDLVVIMTEIIAKHFSLDTIKQVSGVKLLTQQEKQQIQMEQQQAEQMAMQAQQMGQEAPPPPQIPEEIQELLELPTWEEIEGIIRDDTARNFRIDIETDSTIKTDQENEKKARTEFLGAVAGFMQQSVNVPPQLQGFMMELLMFGIRGFKISREIETTFESAMREMRKMEDQPPKPDPALEAEKMKAEGEKQKMAFEGQKMQQDKYLADQNFALEQQKLGVEQEKIKADVSKAKIDAKSKVAPDVALSDPDLNEGQVPPMIMALENMANSLNQGLQMIAQMQMQGNQAVIEAIQNPPARQVVRDGSGNIVGVQ